MSRFLAFSFCFLNVARHTMQCWRRWRLVWFRTDNEQWSMHHIRCWGKSIAHVHPTTPQWHLQSSKWISMRTQASVRVCLWFHENPGICQSLFVIPTLVRQHSQGHPRFSPALRGSPKHITITPSILVYQSSEIPATPVAVVRDPSDSDGLPE